MSKKTWLITGAAVAVVVASTAILAPSIASGTPLPTLFPVSNVAGDDPRTPNPHGEGKHSDGPGNNGRGNAFGHEKDSEDFPGNNGNGNGNGNGNRNGNGNGNGNGNDPSDGGMPWDEGRDKNGEGPGNNGRGNAFGHDKEADDFPGNNGDHHDDGAADDSGQTTEDTPE